MVRWGSTPSNDTITKHRGYNTTPRRYFKLLLLVLARRALFSSSGMTSVAPLTRAQSSAV